MAWEVVLDDALDAELATLDARVRIAILRYASLLRTFGPELGRPYADTLKGSRHPNMKELRPTVNRVGWRVAFAFDEERRAILLAAVAKAGRKRSMSEMIARADQRFDAHQAAIRRGR